jgi:multimeric flavodoxin WrbA
MKILAIIGSPRGKGNCYKLTRKVEEKMSLLGNVEFEYLFLKDVDLKPCRGCGLCYLKGENLCPLKDDRASVEQKMAEADGVVFATPTYVLNVSGIMKNFIDRFAYVSHRPRFFKPALVVSTTGAVGLETTLFMLGLMAGSWGFQHHA